MENRTSIHEYGINVRNDWDTCRSGVTTHKCPGIKQIMNKQEDQGPRGKTPR